MSPTWSRCCFCPKPSPSLTFPMVSSQGWGCSLQRRQNVKTGHNWGKPLWFPSFWQISVHHPPRQRRERRKDPTLKICPCWEDLVLPGSRWLPFRSLPNKQCLGQFVWNPSKGQCFFTQSKSLYFAQYKKLPTAALYQWFMLPLPIWPKYNWRFQILSHHLPPRGISQSLKLLILDIFLLLSLFWTILIRVSYRAVNKQTFVGA